MKAYMIPFWYGKRLAIGACGMRELELRGPILYVPGEGAVFYVTSMRGKGKEEQESIAMKMGKELTVKEIGFLVEQGGVDFFLMAGKDRSIDDFLGRLEKQMRGEQVEGYEGDNYDLSEGVREVNIPKRRLEKFRNMQRKIDEANETIRETRYDALNLMYKLVDETRYTGEERRQIAESFEKLCKKRLKELEKELGSGKRARAGARR